MTRTAQVHQSNYHLYGMSSLREWVLVSSQGNMALSYLERAFLITRLFDSFVTCPMELVKVQLQNQTQATAIKGPIDCLKSLYATGGIRYCFKGMLPTTLRELSFGPYFLTYEFICRAMTTSDPDSINNSTYELSGPKVILAGGSAGIVAWCSTYFAGKCEFLLQSQFTFTHIQLEFTL